MDKKHKKKRSFLSRARKFASRGLYGKGKNIDEETYHYYVEVMKRLNENFEDEEEKGIFVENVFSQTTGSEVELVCNQLVSRVIEKILPYAPPVVFQRFAEALNTDLRIISTDPFASHVLEKMMKLASEFIDQWKLRKALGTVEVPEPKKKKKKSDDDDFPKPSEESLKDEGHLTFCTEWLLKISRFALNNMEEFVTDTYASHVVRTMLQCVSGVNVTSEISKSKKSRDQSDDSDKEVGIKTRDKVFLEILQEFTDRIMSWPQFGDLAYTEASAATLQTVLLVLSGSTGRLLPPLLELLWSRCFFPEDEVVAENELPQVFLDYSAQRTLEVALSVASASFYSNAHEKLFKGRLLLLCEKESKFAVTGLLSSCKDKEKFNEIYEELEPVLKELVSHIGGGILVALAKACKKLQTNQAKFLTAAMEVFGCEGSEESQLKLVQLAVRLQTSKESTEDSKVTYAGSQLVQTLLHFNKPIKIINSLLGMSSADLRELLCDPCGSFIMDAFVSSPSIGEKSRDRLRTKLKGEYVALACSKNGSRSFDSLWAASDIKSRAVIGQELLTREAQVSGNQWGSIIFNRYAVSLLRKRKTDWEAFQGEETKKRKLFKDFLENTPEKNQTDSEKKKNKIKVANVLDESETLE